MKIAKSQLKRIISEEIATVDDDAIEDVVMGVLSDEGGAAGEEPIADALEDLENDEISLPDESIEDIIKSVTGVKRHTDGDYVDSTKLEGKRLRSIVREALSTEVPDIAPRRKSSFQVHQEKTMAARIAKRDSQISKVADMLKKDPASATKLIDSFPPAMDLRASLGKARGAGYIDAFLDKIEAQLQAQGVDRSAAIKFADSFLRFD